MSRLFNALISYVLFLLTFPRPVEQTGLFLHQTQASTGLIYGNHILSWGVSVKSITPAERLLFLYFLTVIQQHPYTTCEFPRSYQCCVWRIYMALCTYIEVHKERAWVWGRRDHFSQRYIFCLHAWYDMYEVLYLVRLCGGAQGLQGFLRTKKRKVPVYLYYIRMHPIKNRGFQTTPGNALSLVPRLIYSTWIWYLVHNR